MRPTTKTSSVVKMILITFLVFSIVLLISCSNKTESNTNTQTTSQDSDSITTTKPNTTSITLADKKVEYFNVDTISGSFNATDDVSVTWQKNGLIRSEVKVFMDTVHWGSDITSSSTMSNRSDLDGDGEEEQIVIQSEPNTGAMSIYISIDGKTVNLFGLVSQEFLDAVQQMPGGEDGSGLPIYIDAACKDLDGDNKGEIILAVGNDNGALVVSLLKYIGGDLLYKEVGGVKGTKVLRYFIVTTRNTLFAELYFTNPPSNKPEDMNYVEYEYKGSELKQIRYRNVNVSEENAEENIEDELDQEEYTDNTDNEDSYDSQIDTLDATPNIIGKWASHETGQINGQSSSDDELITFMDNGTFTDVIVTSGPLMKGILREEGKFKVIGDKIIFYDCTESWTPDPDTSTKKEAYKDKPIDDFEYEYEFIDYESISISMRTYDRVK